MTQPRATIIMTDRPDVVLLLSDFGNIIPQEFIFLDGEHTFTYRRIDDSLSYEVISDATP